MRSIPGVCEVALIRGQGASDVPDLLLEVPHGATRAADFRTLRNELRGEFPAGLEDFFFVNTDVGAPEVALRAAELFVAAQPGRSAAVIRCLIPRTFIDCNRVIDPSAAPSPSAAGEVTPGMQAWVRDPQDFELLMARYSAYRELVEHAAQSVCSVGGRMLMVHTYAPRSLDVPVDENIVARLRQEYTPSRIESWPLRAPVDLIVDTPEGERLADPSLVERATAEFASAGYDVVLNGAYTLHPVTLAARIAAQFKGRTLCLEIRRDLLVPQFTPFQEMFTDPMRVERLAGLLARAL